MKTLHDFKVKAIDGSEFNFSKLQGKKVLVVNTASECGLTPQYAQLQELYEQTDRNKLEIIAFPANNFGGQEPGSDDEIAQFCEKNYGVTFPVMSKVSVKGSDKHPVFQWLTTKNENGVADIDIAWNFQKFLVDESGRLVKSVGPQTLPVDQDITSWIEG